MLAVSPLSTTTTTKDGCGRHQLDMDSFSVGADIDFPDFDSIDFDDLFGGDALPYLEVDPGFLSDFSVCPSTSAGEDETSAVSVDCAANQIVPSSYNGGNSSSDEESKKDVCRRSSSKEEEIQSKKSSPSPPVKTKKSSKNNADNNNNNEGKRKTKVDWTPDLHRRFVQAVEQLGVDKAVPSRILELMGIDCLTRHNVASHLQKYRSHRKHLLAREAEAATWTQKRQMYSMGVVAPPPNVKANTNHHWPAPPTMGFPPPAPPPVHHHPFRPLHVWGHPTHPVDHQSSMHVWPKPIQPPPHAWPAPLPAHPPPLSADPSLWHTRHHQRIPHGVAPLTHCYPHPLPSTRYGVAPPVPGIPPTHAAMYRPNQHGIGEQPRSLQPGPAHPDPVDMHPSKESIDAAIGEVLTKPWLPLPIGLKPPATDSVMGELERQGVPAVPPSCA